MRSIGIHQRPGDLEVNVVKQKALTNMRSANKGITVGLTAPIEMSLDACVEYLAADEVLEVTPSKMRMAKNPDLQVKRKGKN
jgi:GTP-binding protein